MKLHVVRLSKIGVLLNQKMCDLDFSNVGMKIIKELVLMGKDSTKYPLRDLELSLPEF